MAYGTPGIQTHEQWLGLVQPVGLVVAPAVLSKLELFPNQGTAYLSSLQRQLDALLEERDSAEGDPIQVVPGFPLLATDLLAWDDTDLVAASAMAEDRQRCLDAGMDDLLAKPIEPATSAATSEMMSP